MIKQYKRASAGVVGARCREPAHKSPLQDKKISQLIFFMVSPPLNRCSLLHSGQWHRRLSSSLDAGCDAPAAQTADLARQNGHKPFEHDCYCCRKGRRANRSRQIERFLIPCAEDLVFNARRQEERLAASSSGLLPASFSQGVLAGARADWA